ncbi:MAG: T9SS type A sorting domain-containing protein [Gemmatimonadaceae bacterium]|nr:T9SS type A sorting domain-containing protein [Chitinophagaceae bacterium]
MKSFRSVLTGLLVFISMSISYGQAPGLTVNSTTNLHDNINCFWEYLPRDYNTDAPKKYPLMIFLHGVGESGTSDDQTTYERALFWGPGKLMRNGSFPESFTVGGNTHRFIAIMPQIKEGLVLTPPYIDTIQPALVDAVIEYAKANFRVDESRIYLCGLSMGGGGTLHYAGAGSHFANKLAAIVTACPARTITVAEANVIAAANLPILNTHNNDDGSVGVSYSHTNMARIKAYNPPIMPEPRAIYWESGGHDVWQRTYENIAPGSTTGGFVGNVTDTLGMNVYEWMLQFTRNSALASGEQGLRLGLRQGKPQLSWEAEEKKTFTVERSIDRSTWKTVATVNAPANNSKLYGYTDTDPLPAALIYYRLASKDANGRNHYSEVKSINLQTATDNLKSFPNPFTDEITIPLGKLSERTITVRITDEKGSIVRQKTFQVNSATAQVKLTELNTLKAGLYYITVYNASNILIRRETILK